jgi:transposase
MNVDKAIDSFISVNHGMVMNKVGFKKKLLKLVTDAQKAQYRKGLGDGMKRGTQLEKLRAKKQDFWTILQITKEFDISYNTYIKRRSSGMSFKKALTAPIDIRKSNQRVLK